MKPTILILALAGLTFSCKEEKKSSDPQPAIAITTTTLPITPVDTTGGSTQVNGSLSCYGWLDNLTRSVIPGKTFAQVYSDQGPTLFVSMINPVIDQLDRNNVLAAKDAASLRDKLASLSSQSSSPLLRNAIILGLSIVKCDFLPSRGGIYDVLAGVLQTGYNRTQSTR